MNERKPSLKITLARIERHKAAIGKHRDALRDILDDLQGVVDAADDGFESLNYAIEKLSELL
jgi:ABC-type transporter Mla subunit MlaD